MKAKLAAVLLLGLVICSSALAQTNPPAADKPASPEPATAPAQSGAVIPLIQFQDVQLTTAIENLARQAGINYILDPKVTYGQPGPDGKPMPQPSISLRWENLTAEQALMAVLNNYSLQMIEDSKTRITRITTRDPAAPDPLVTRVIQLKFTSPSNILGAVQTVLTDKRSKAIADVRSSQLVLLATEKELDGVNQLVERLDTATKQVLIEAKLLETSMNPISMKGIDWSGTLQAQNLSFGNGVVQQAVTTFMAPGTPTTVTLPGGRQITTSPSSSSTTVSPPSGSSSGSSGGSGSGGLGTLSGGLVPNGFSMNTLSGLTPNIGFLNADGVHAVLSFLNQSSDAKVLSEPRTVTMDNEMASLSVTRASPIINVTAGTANTTGGSQISYTNLGVILYVTPRISANNFVNLKVAPEVSRLADTITKVIGGQTFQADEYDLRKMETHVMIPSGNTLVLGGLMQDDVRNSDTKVPLLGDIPILGHAFHSNVKQRQKANLLVFITPTIVKDSDFQPNVTHFLQTSPVPEMDTTKWSPIWDIAKPADWSNLKEKTSDEAAAPAYASEPKQ